MKLLILGLIFLTSLVVAAAGKTKAEDPQVVEIRVTSQGFEPKLVNVKPGVAVILKVTRTTDTTCATEIQIPDKKIRKALPLNETVTIEIGQLQKGEIRFGCGMNMMESGQIFVH